MVADDAEEKGYQAYEEERQGELAEGGIARAGKGDADSQCVDAGGNGKEQLGA